MNIKTVSVFGLGYIGLPTATIIASQGVNVIGVDVCEHAVNSVNAGQLHIIEPELGDVLKNVVQKGHLRAALTPEPADASSPYQLLSKRGTNLTSAIFSLSQSRWLRSSEKGISSF